MSRQHHNNMTHRRSARIHFFKRCRERYGIILSDDDYKQIMEAIRHNQRSGKVTAFFTKDLDRETKLYQVNIDDVSMYVIFNLTLNELTTSLPERPKEIEFYATGTSIF
jgi:hypothetical protein